MTAIGGVLLNSDKETFLLMVIAVLAISIAGAVLTMGVDLDGTRWLKFVVYLIFFASISSTGLFSSRFSCSFKATRLRK